MAKKTYVTAWMDLGDDGDITIEIGASQGTSGNDSPFSFANDVPSAIVALIQAQ